MIYLKRKKHQEEGNQGQRNYQRYRGYDIPADRPNGLLGVLVFDHMNVTDLVCVYVGHFNIRTIVHEFVVLVIHHDGGLIHAL